MLGYENSSANAKIERKSWKMKKRRKKKSAKGEQKRGKKLEKSEKGSKRRRKRSGRGTGRQGGNDVKPSVQRPTEQHKFRLLLCNLCLSIRRNFFQIVNFVIS